MGAQAQVSTTNGGFGASYSVGGGGGGGELMVRRKKRSDYEGDINVTATAGSSRIDLDNNTDLSVSPVR